MQLGGSDPRLSLSEIKSMSAADRADWMLLLRTYGELLDSEQATHREHNPKPRR